MDLADRIWNLYARARVYQVSSSSTAREAFVDKKNTKGRSGSDEKQRGAFGAGGGEGVVNGTRGVASTHMRPVNRARYLIRRNPASRWYSSAWNANGAFENFSLFYHR